MFFSIVTQTALCKEDRHEKPETEWHKIHPYRMSSHLGVDRKETETNRGAQT